jgi:hypothetical protein
MNTRAFLLAALIGGAAMAVLSNIPIINLGNCLVCLWLWGGGVLAVNLYNRYAPGKAQLSQAMLVGLAAGFAGGVLGLLLGWLTSAATQQTVLRLLETREMFGFKAGDLPFNAGGPFSPFGLFVAFIVYPFWGLVGGFIGGTIYRKK